MFIPNGETKQYEVTDQWWDEAIGSPLLLNKSK